jgi:hypothetical protein
MTQQRGHLHSTSILYFFLLGQLEIPSAFCLLVKSGKVYEILAVSERQKTGSKLSFC